MLVEIGAASVIAQEIERILRDGIAAVDDLAGAGGGDRSRTEIDGRQGQRVILSEGLPAGKAGDGKLAQSAKEEAISDRVDLAEDSVADGKIGIETGNAGKMPLLALSIDLE